jgi:hypothetical protein
MSAPNGVNSLAKALPLEQARVRQLRQRYATSAIASRIEAALQRAQIAAESGNVVEMLRSYHELKAFESPAVP